MPLENTSPISTTNNPDIGRGTTQPTILHAAASTDITAGSSGAARVWSPTQIAAGPSDSLRTQFTGTRDYAKYAALNRSEPHGGLILPDLDITIRRKESLQGLGGAPGVHPATPLDPAQPFRVAPWRLVGPPWPVRATEPGMPLLAAGLSDTGCVIWLCATDASGTRGGHSLCHVYSDANSEAVSVITEETEYLQTQGFSLLKEAHVLGSKDIARTVVGCVRRLGYATVMDFTQDGQHPAYITFGRNVGGLMTARDGHLEFVAIGWGAFARPTAPEKATNFAAGPLSNHLEAFFKAEDRAPAALKLSTGVALLRKSQQGLAGTGLMHSLDIVDRACALFAKAHPCRQVDLKHMAHAMFHTRPSKEPFVTKDFVEWCVQIVAAVQSLDDLGSNAHEMPDLPSSLMSRLGDLREAGELNLARGLQENGSQLGKLIDRQSEELMRHAKALRAELGESPTLRQLLDALASMEKPHAHATRLADESADFAALVRCVTDSLPRRDDTNLTAAAFFAFSQTTAVCLLNRVESSKLALNANVARLQVLATAARTNRSPLMKDLTAVVRKAEHLMSNLDSVKRRRDVMSSPAIAHGLAEHAGQQCHELEVDLWNVSSKLANERATTSMLITPAIVVTDAAANSFGQMKSSFLYMFAAASPAFKQETTSEDVQTLERLKKEIFSPYAEEPDPEGDLSALGAGAASSSATAAPDDSSSPGASRRVRGTASARPTPPAGSGDETAALRRAHDNFTEAVSLNPDLANNSLRYAQMQVAKARRETNDPGEHPVSVAKLMSWIDQACDTLQRCASKVGEHLRLLRAAKSEIDRLEPASAAKTDRLREAAARETEWEAQINALRTRVSELRAEGKTLSCAQMVNVFISVPTYYAYKKLAAFINSDDFAIDLSVRKTVERNQLPAKTVLGFKKPNADFLDKYLITVRTRKSGANGWTVGWTVAGTTEGHFHYNSPAANEAPRWGSLQTPWEAGSGDPSRHRGHVPQFELAGIVEDLSRRAGRARQERLDINELGTH